MKIEPVLFELTDLLCIQASKKL